MTDRSARAYRGWNGRFWTVSSPVIFFDSQRQYTSILYHFVPDWSVSTKCGVTRSRFEYKCKNQPHSMLWLLLQRHCCTCLRVEICPPQYAELSCTCRPSSLLSQKLPSLAHYSHSRTSSSGARCVEGDIFPPSTKCNRAPCI